MKKLLHIAGRLIILAVFVGAAWLLYGNVEKMVAEDLGRSPEGLGEMLSVIWQAMGKTPWHAIAGASLLTVLNYAILIGYDVLAIRWIRVKLPLWRISWASLTSYAFSYNFGATLFGTSIRWRFYSAWGVSLMKILELLLILGLTFWFGLFFLAGLVFIFDPLTVPEQLVEKFQLPFVDTYWFGWLLLAISATYVALSAGAMAAERAGWRGFKNGSLQLWRWTIPVPPLKLTIKQIAIASADLLVAAAVLHALLPPMDGLHYFTTLGAFMLAFTISVLTHVPGGYGVFELIMIEFLPDGYGLQILAALIVFRVVYYWGPLLVGAGLLAALELTLRGQSRPELPKELPKAEAKALLARDARGNQANGNDRTV